MAGTNFSSAERDGLIFVTISGTIGGARNGSRRSAATADDGRAARQRPTGQRESVTTVCGLFRRGNFGHTIRRNGGDDGERFIGKGGEWIVESGKTGRNNRRINGGDNSRSVGNGGDVAWIVGNGERPHTKTGLTDVWRLLVARMRVSSTVVEFPRWWRLTCQRSKRIRYDRTRHGVRLDNSEACWHWWHGWMETEIWTVECPQHTAVEAHRDMTQVEQYELYKGRTVWTQ